MENNGYINQAEHFDSMDGRRKTASGANPMGDFLNGQAQPPQMEYNANGMPQGQHAAPAAETPAQQPANNGFYKAPTMPSQNQQGVPVRERESRLGGADRVMGRMMGESPAPEQQMPNDMAPQNSQSAYEQMPSYLNVGGVPGTFYPQQGYGQQPQMPPQYPQQFPQQAPAYISPMAMFGNNAAEQVKNAAPQEQTPVPSGYPQQMPPQGYGQPQQTAPQYPQQTYDPQTGYAPQTPQMPPQGYGQPQQTAPQYPQQTYDPQTGYAPQTPQMPPLGYGQPQQTVPQGYGQGIPSGYGAQGVQYPNDGMTAQGRDEAEAEGYEDEEDEELLSYRYGEVEKPKGTFRKDEKEGPIKISVYSPKGGVGKSSVSTSLACAYTNDEARIEGRTPKVLLVDFDWSSGDIATLLLQRENHIPDLGQWARKMQMDFEEEGEIPPYAPSMIQKYIVHVSDELDLLAAPRDPMDSEKITVEMVAAMCDNLERCKYDIIIYDNRNSLEERTLVVLDHSDEVVVIATPDMTTLRELKKMKNTLRNRSFNTKKLHLIVNNVPQKTKDQDIPVSGIVDAFPYDFITEIPKDDDVRKSGNVANNLLWEGVDSQFTRSIKTIATTFCNVYPEKKKGFFQKLFGGDKGSSGDKKNKRK